MSIKFRVANRLTCTTTLNNDIGKSMKISCLEKWDM